MNVLTYVSVQACTWIIIKTEFQTKTGETSTITIRTGLPRCPLVVIIQRIRYILVPYPHIIHRAESEGTMSPVICKVISNMVNEYKIGSIEVMDWSITIVIVQSIIMFLFYSKIASTQKDNDQ